MTLLSANQIAFIFRANDKVANNFRSDHIEYFASENQINNSKVLLFKH